MGKLLTIGFTEKERFALYIHFSQNVVTNSAKEQDEYGELWDSFKLDEIEDKLDALRMAGKAGDANLDDFSKAELAVEFDKEDAGHFIAFCGRPMKGGLSREIRPMRVRVAEARDRAGMKSIPAESAG